MKSVYVIGGAGVGKSTFTAELLTQLGVEAEPVEDLYRGPGGGKDAFRTRRIRGHALVAGGQQRGTYLGVLRDEFPGTDGLDKVILPVCARWISDPDLSPITGYLIAEGLRLANPDFLLPLAARSDLLVIHLMAEDYVTDLRLLKRGAGQPAQFIKASKSRASRLASSLRSYGINVINCDTVSATCWRQVLCHAEAHLTSHDRSLI